MNRPREASAPGLRRWHVYILATARGALYTGITTNVARRMREHGGARGARYFRLAPAVRLLYVEPRESRSSASKREAAIKKMTRREKLALVAAYGSGAAAARSA